jgi:hypothetical protein
VDDAWAATSTRDGRGPHHTVARPQRVAVHIPLQVGAELLHDAKPLVAQHERCGNIEMSPLEVNVGSADPAVGAGHDEPALRRRRYVELVQHERLAESTQHHSTAPPHTAISCLVPTAGSPIHWHSRDGTLATPLPFA